MKNLKVIDHGAVLCKDGKIEFAGAEVDLPSELIPSSAAYEVIDAGGNVVLPGFIDSHTHLIFGGFRPDEFKWRLQGESYMSIMQRGGGIRSTVKSTRETDNQKLSEKAEWFLERMSRMGITTVEVKSGYGLDDQTEIRMLDVINDLSHKHSDKIDIVPTYLGPHAIPDEFAGRPSEYIEYIITDILPKIKGKAAFCDIFTEKNVFEIDDSRRYLNAAKSLGYALKLHADEIVTLGGAELAVECGAVSADHLLHVSEEGIRQLAAGNTIATLLPLTAFALKEEYAPARKLIDAGVAVALATDLNPGSCFSGSIPLMIALAAIYMKMDIEEIITALTLNGAAALGLAGSKGSLEIGKDADMVILEFDNINMLPYYIGMNCVKTTICKGNIVVNM